MGGNNPIKRPPLNQPKFSLISPDEGLRNLVEQSDHRTLGVWARDCALRVLPFFKNAYPEDPRPQQALDALQGWINTGQFSMAAIRSASLAAHAAARQADEASPARSAARAAGQALATAHVPAHAYSAAKYAQQATFRASPEQALHEVEQERDWQFQHLVVLNQKRQP